MRIRKPFIAIGVMGIAISFFVTTISKAEQGKKEFAADRGPDKLDISQYSKEMQQAYKVFSVKCAKCHTLARAINTDMTTQAWKMYVKRMMNKPDSGISPSTGRRIYQFLKFRQAEKDIKRSKK